MYTELVICPKTLISRKFEAPSLTFISRRKMRQKILEEKERKMFLEKFLGKNGIQTFFSSRQFRIFGMSPELLIPKTCSNQKKIIRALKWRLVTVSACGEATDFQF